MKRLLSLILLNFSIALFAQEKAYVYYNKLFNEGEGYEVANIKGAGSTWEWFGRSLRFSNSFNFTGDPGSDYPECEDWIVLGPFDLSVAQNPVFEALVNVEVGENKLSVLASNNFDGSITPGLTSMPGAWSEILSKESISAEVGIDTKVSASLSHYSGDREVYIGIKYSTKATKSAYTNIIKEPTVTRDVGEGVTEMLPGVTLSRSKAGVDYFNLSANSSSSSKWSIRTGYAKATNDNDIWLIMKPFDLTNEADAFFSFESKLLNSTSGPVGLQIKIYRGSYTEGQNINDLEWEDYPVSRVDHRVNPSNYFSSGKLDLSQFLGSNVSIAFRNINSNGEQYEIKSFKMFSLSDVEPPVISTFQKDTVVWNKISFKLNSNEEADLLYGIYDAGETKPTFEELKLAGFGGTLHYDERGQDTIYTIKDLLAETDYKLVIGMKDQSGNQSGIEELLFTTPKKDLESPTFDVEYVNVENHTLQVQVTPSEVCNYYYKFQKSALGELTKEQLISDGVKVIRNGEKQIIDIYNLDKDTDYQLFIYGIDLPGNESEITSFGVKTLNQDFTAPVFNVFKVDNISNTDLNVNVNLSEVSRLFYSVQIQEELPPSVEGIKKGDRAVLFGEFDYKEEDVDQGFSIEGLSTKKDYVLYLYAQDAAGNNSAVKYSSFSTLNNNVPVISYLNGERIYIDIEASYSFEIEDFNYSNITNIDGFNLVVLEGDNYKLNGATITAKDDYAGRIVVPMYIQKDDLKSNTLKVELVVSESRMAKEFESMREAMVGYNLQPVVDISAAIALLEMQADGSFFDKLSSNSPDYADYCTKVLNGRLKDIADNYFSEDYRRRKRKEVRHKMYKALGYWMDHRPEWSLKECRSEWVEAMGAIVLVLYDDMQEEYLEDESMRATIEDFQSKVLEFNRWCWNTPDDIEVFQPYQGTNLSSRLWGAMAMAVFNNSVSDAYVVYDALLEDMSYKHNSGLNAPAGWKADGSFHMNNMSGGQWNWYGHGTDWLTDVLEYSEFARRSTWRIPQEKFQLMGDVLTDGGQWLNWMDFIPYSLTSKHATRKGKRNNKNVLLNLYNQVRYEAFVNNQLLENNEELMIARDHLDQEFSTLDSTKYFWNSNIMIHSNSLYNITLTMPSVRTGAPEAGVDSIYGITNHHMGDGTSLIFNSDLAYEQRIYWNYKKLPGTTIEQNNASLPDNFGGNNGKSLNDFAGGCSNGSEGVASFYFDRNGTGNVNGYKSYFFFEEGMVAMGCKINKKINNRVSEVVTSIDQQLVETDVVYNTGGETVSTVSLGTLNYEKEIPLTESAWVHHNNNGYVIVPQEGGETVNIGVKEQRGSWDEINGTWRWELNNSNYIMRYDSAAVLQLDINHLKEPVNAKYAYMVFPSKSLNSFKELVADNPIEIINNSDSVQVVWHKTNKTAGIVFLKPCTAVINSEIAVVVDKPLTMLLKEKSNGEIEAWVNDPNQKEKLVDVRFMITRTNEKPLDIQRLVVLPSGVNKGKPVYTCTGDIWAITPVVDENKEVVDESTDKEDEENGTENETGDEVLKGIAVYPSILDRSDSFNIKYSSENGSGVKIEIFNLYGIKVYVNNLSNAQGVNIETINCSDLGHGVFIVKVSEGNKSCINKIVVR